MVTVRYGINRRNPQTRKIEHQNHKCCFLKKGDLLPRMESLVRRKHPGWFLTGYAIVRKNVGAAVEELAEAQRTTPAEPPEFLNVLAAAAGPSQPFDATAARAEFAPRRGWNAGQPTVRKTFATYRDQGKERRITVVLYPSGRIGLRLQGLRSEESVTAAWCYEQAVLARVLGEKKQRRK